MCSWCFSCVYCGFRTTLAVDSDICYTLFTLATSTGLPISQYPLNLGVFPGKFGAICVDTDKMDPNQPSCSRDTPTASQGDDEPPVKRRRYVEEVLSAWNFSKILRELGTREQGIAFAEEQGLIAAGMNCRVHRIPMKVDLTANNTVGHFYCSKKTCRQKTRLSRTQGTWFDNVKLQLLHIYYLMYCFAHRWTHEMVIHEDPLRDINKKCLSRPTITDWYSYCRETVVLYQMNQEQDQLKIGGPGKIVQIDEIKFGKGQYNKGRRVEGQWVLGFIEDGSEDLRLEVCPDNIRSAEVLIPLIQKHVHTGTTIHYINDYWRVYECLDQYGYIHKKVSHSDPDKPFVAEFLWRRSNEKYKRDPFTELIKTIKYIYNNNNE